MAFLGLAFSILWIRIFYVCRKPTRTSGHLAIYERALTHYQLSSPFVRQTVLVGPSYIAYLGPLENAHNLGISGAGQPEIEHVISLCRQRDTVLYFVTTREILTADKLVRDAVASRRIRYKLIARDSFRKPIIPAANLPTHHFIVERQLKGYAAPEFSDISLDLFERLHVEYPNIVFVLFPCLPAEGLSEYPDLIENASRASALADYLATLFQQSDLPFVDLTHSLEPADFIDLYHLSPQGIEKFRAKVKKLVATANPPLSHSRIAPGST